MSSRPYAIPRRIPRLRPGREVRAFPRRTAAATLVLWLGPATVAAGLVWALLQPYRITLLDPKGEGFWSLAVEPPLLVILVGAVFPVAVARGLARDIVHGDRASA